VCVIVGSNDEMVSSSDPPWTNLKRERESDGCFALDELEIHG